MKFLFNLNDLLQALVALFMLKREWSKNSPNHLLDNQHFEIQIGNTMSLTFKSSWLETIWMVVPHFLGTYNLK